MLQEVCSHLNNKMYRLGPDVSTGFCGLHYVGPRNHTIDAMQQNSKLLLNCSCGEVEVQIAGSPAACAYCHCTSCRDFYGLPVLAATAWRNEAVQVVKGSDRLGEYQHPTKQMQRHFCRACGETMFGTNRLGLTVVRTSLLARSSGGSLSAEFNPKLHLFYAYRELDVDDELPKYLEGTSGPLFSKPEPQRA